MKNDHYARARSLVAALALVAGGCGGDDGGIVARAAGESKLSGVDREAADFVRSKVAEHWVQGPDGWTTQYQQRNLFGDVMPGEPELKFHQYRALELTVEPETLSESQKLNGADYRAAISFAKTSERFYRLVDTFEGPRGWSLWSDAIPGMFVAVERRNGRWLISETTLFDGILPDSPIPSGR